MKFGDFLTDPKDPFNLNKTPTLLKETNKYHFSPSLENTDFGKFKDAGSGMEKKARLDEAFRIISGDNKFHFKENPPLPQQRETLDDYLKKNPPLKQQYVRVYTFRDLVEANERQKPDKNDCIPLDPTPRGRMVPYPFFHNVLGSSLKEIQAENLRSCGARPAHIEPNRELEAIRANPLPY